MSFEGATITKISELNESAPDAADLRSQGDDHLRVIKRVLKATFPNFTDPWTSTSAQANNVPVLGCYGALLGTGCTVPASGSLGTFTAYTGTANVTTAAVSVDSSTGIMTINTAGTYKLDFHVSYVMGTAGFLIIGLYKNTSTALVGASATLSFIDAGISRSLALTTVVSLSATDTIRARINRVGTFGVEEIGFTAVRLGLT